MAWFRRKDPKIEEQPASEERRVKTEGVFTQCVECGAALYKGDLEATFQVCPHCGYHFRLDAMSRLRWLFDESKFITLDDEIISGDPLKFVDSKPYPQRLAAARKSSGLNEAVLTGTGKVSGHLVYAGAMDMNFIGGSMGSAVGEKLTRIIERAVENSGAVIIFAASGGARMQEGTLSLMQMAKVSAALAQLSAARLPFISVLTDPTTGGVTASFAMLGDINIGEPKALIGFAGPRVIEQTIRQKLPKGFQRSEFLLEHGMLDMVVDRREMRQVIVSLLNYTHKPQLAPTDELLLTKKAAK